MQVRIFTLPFSPRLGGFDDEPLRVFIADKQMHSLENWHFVHEHVAASGVKDCTGKKNNGGSGIAPDPPDDCMVAADGVEPPTGGL